MFTGFTPEAIDFLWGIRMNNNRPWFLEHKQQYVTQVYEPMKALGKQLFEPFWDQPGNELKVSRIYRDARLHHPLPYKESLWLCIRKQNAYWAESPCLYLEITPEGVSYGFLMWRPRPAFMKDFRAKLAANPQPFLDLMQQAEKELGFPLSCQCYKHPEPTEDPRLQPYYLWKQGLVWAKEVPPGDAMFSPALYEDAARFFRALTPLYEYFSQV